MPSKLIPINEQAVFDAVIAEINEPKPSKALRREIKEEVELAVGSYQRGHWTEYELLIGGLFRVHEDTVDHALSTPAVGPAGEITDEWRKRNRVRITTYEVVGNLINA